MMFEEILKNHHIEIVKVVDKKTFEVVSVSTKDGTVLEENETVHFETIKELLIWLGY